MFWHILTILKNINFQLILVQFARAIFQKYLILVYKSSKISFANLFS